MPVLNQSNIENYKLHKHFINYGYVYKSELFFNVAYKEYLKGNKEPMLAYYYNIIYKIAWTLTAPNDVFENEIIYSKEEDIPIEFFKMYCKNKSSYNRYRYLMLITKSIIVLRQKVEFNAIEYWDIVDMLFAAVISHIDKYRDNPNYSAYRYADELMMYKFNTALSKIFKNNNHKIVTSIECVPEEIYLQDFTKEENNANRTLLYKREKTKLKLKEKDIDVYSDESFNYNWILGVCCSEEFSKLSIYDRIILVEHYVYKNNFDVIRKKLCLSNRKNKYWDSLVRAKSKIQY